MGHIFVTKCKFVIKKTYAVRFHKKFGSLWVRPAKIRRRPKFNSPLPFFVVLVWLSSAGGACQVRGLSLAAVAPRRGTP
jgi:hypothetical protein